MQPENPKRDRRRNRWWHMDPYRTFFTGANPRKENEIVAFILVVILLLVGFYILSFYF